MKTVELSYGEAYMIWRAFDSLAEIIKRKIDCKPDTVTITEEEVKRLYFSTSLMAEAMKNLKGELK